VPLDENHQGRARGEKGEGDKIYKDGVVQSRKYDVTV
jgi:hypothetical protein